MVNMLALTELLGSPVYDSTGTHAGKVREVAVFPQEDPRSVGALVVRTKAGDLLVQAQSVKAINTRVDVATPQGSWTRYAGSEGMLLLGRDLLDQQIIDIYGRKVVRVNDVELAPTSIDEHIKLRIGAVDVGARGAVRRLLKGIVPASTLRRMLQRFPPKMIPWDFVDLIETDPARRVKLKIELERLSKLHPADIADIVEELAPAEREAVFQTLDEEVAAETLEEIDPKLQAAIVSSLDNDRAADIVEEMDPDAAADLLGDLPPERSQEILKEMQPEEREDVAELLEFEENTAAGRMTTDMVALTDNATVRDAVEMLRAFEGDIESVNTIFLTGADGKLVGAVPLQRLVLSSLDTSLVSLCTPPLIAVHVGVDENEVAEKFDKYNLLSLPVVDEEGLLTGVITADDVIAMLRKR